MNIKRGPLIVIAGPTAVGKTSLSIKLAQNIDGEIISGDSMQIYKGLDIGTAKIKKEEMEGIPHYLIDIIEPNEQYNVQIFQENTKKLITDILNRGKIPIIVGGTGLYIDALVYDYNFIKEETVESNEVRDKLLKEYETFGKDHIIDKLMEIDPKSLEEINNSNIQRIIRAIEVFYKTGVKFSELEKNSKETKESPYELFYFVITMNRKELYDRINERVDLMFSEGWIEEVKGLLSSGRGLPKYRSLQALGYKQIIQFINNSLTYEECLYKIKQETRRFAKRQLTWFKKNKDIIWFDRSIKNQEEILNEILSLIKK